MLKSNGSFRAVRFTEVVRISEGPLREVPLYRDCIKRNGDKTRMQSTRYIVTSCHGNDDEMWSTSCLIIQYKP